MTHQSAVDKKCPWCGGSGLDVCWECVCSGVDEDGEFCTGCGGTGTSSCEFCQPIDVQAFENHIAPSGGVGQYLNHILTDY